MKKLLSKIVIASIAWQSVLFLVSFLMLSSCCNFPDDIKQEDMALTLTILDETVQLSGNPIWINTTSDREGVTQQKMLLRITCIDGSVDGGPWILSKSGVSASFDIHGIVDAPFDYKFDYYNLESILSHPLLVADFTLEVGETFVANSDLQTEWLGSTQSIQILKGKLTDTEISVLKTDSTTFYEKYIVGKRFLTNTLNEQNQTYRVSSVNDEIKLWFCFLDGVFVNPLLIIRYDDGSETLERITLAEPSSSVLYEINAHLIAASKAIAGKTILYYLLQLSGGPAVWVYIDNKYHEVHKQLYIVNRFGGIEVLHCYGNISEDITTTAETYTKQLGVDSTIFDAAIVSQSSGNAQTYKINTGYKTLDERRWIKDLLLSPYRLAWFKDESLLHLDGYDFGISPIVITPGSYQIDTTSIDLLPIEFEFTIAYND